MSDDHMDVDSTECSSADEDRRLKQSSARPAKRARKVKAEDDGDAAVAPAVRFQLPLPLPIDVARMEAPVLPANIPRMYNMAELMMNHEQLRVNLDGSPVCVRYLQPSPASPVAAAAAAAAASASPISTPPQQQEHQPIDDVEAAFQAVMRVPRIDPQAHWTLLEFEQRLSKLERAELYLADGLQAAPATQEQLNQSLRRRLISTEIMRAHLDSQLLAECGTYTLSHGRSITFPPCVEEAQCVCMDKSYFRRQPRGFIMTAAMFHPELVRLLADNVAPKTKRPCIACMRHRYTLAVTMDRQIRAQGDSRQGDSVMKMRRTGHEIQQWWRNLKDQDGGYHAQHVIDLTDKPEDPVLDPVCLPGRSHLICKEDPTFTHAETKQPRLVVDQSVVIWKKPTIPVPEVGQSLLNFCLGAGSRL
jgi:hypothetical protein